jgi:hypothetical protein
MYVRVPKQMCTEKSVRFSTSAGPLTM